MGVDLDMTELKNTQRTYSGLAVPGINGGRAERIWDFPKIMMLSPYAAISHRVRPSGSLPCHALSGIPLLPPSQRIQDKSAPQAGMVAGYAHTDLNINYSRGVNYPSPIVLMNMVLDEFAGQQSRTILEKRSNRKRWIIMKRA